MTSLHTFATHALLRSRAIGPSETVMSNAVRVMISSLDQRSILVCVRIRSFGMSERS